jgi:hypothetical protein
MALVDLSKTMPESTEVGSPDWWLARLMPRLAAQADRAANLDIYYRGDQTIPIAAAKAVRQAYQRLMAIARTNFAELIVEAVRERQVVGGFRTGASDDPTGDAEAWRLWQANALDADADLVHRAQLAMAVAYVIVGRDDDSGEVIITPEDPRQVIAETDPVRRRKVRAALKVYRDDLVGVDRALLLLPGRAYKASREAWIGENTPVSLSADGWTWDPGTPEVVPGDVVPVVPFRNRPDLYGIPKAEFEPHLPLLDRINYSILSRLEIATLQAFRQRAVKGVPKTDEAGNDIDYDDIFAADPGALWLLPETAELWESGQVDLGPIRAAIRDDVEHLAAVTRMPIGYLEPVNESAEGVDAKREGLIFTVEDRNKQTGESWEQVMSLAFVFAGDTDRARRADMEIIWADPARRSLAERADAAAKAQAGGLTWRAIMETVWQFSPQKIARMEAERASDALRAAVLARTTAAPAAPVVTGSAPTVPPEALGGPEMGGRPAGR